MIPAGRTDLLHGIARDLDIETGQKVSCESKICTLGPSNSGSSFHSSCILLMHVLSLSITCQWLFVIVTFFLPLPRLKHLLYITRQPMNHTSVVATPTHETMSHLALKVIGPIRIGDLIARRVGASVEVWEVRELVLHVGIIYSEEFFRSFS